MHTMYVKADVWEVADRLSWTVLFMHGNTKMRYQGSATSRDACRTAVEGRIDALLDSIGGEAPLRRWWHEQ